MLCGSNGKSIFLTRVFSEQSRQIPSQHWHIQHRIIPMIVGNFSGMLEI
jgi:hypothetical protein